MTKSKSLLDLMDADDAKRAIERGQKRISKQRTRKGLDVSPEIYTVAEFGYYFGWEGVLAIRRGYIEKVGPDGSIVKDPFLLDEALVLLEGARKVWYSKLTEQTHSTMIGNSFRSSSKSFDGAISQFTERATVKE